MSRVGLGPTDLVGSHLDGTNLLQIDKIPANTPSQDLLKCILEHEENGTPLVITGIDCDSHWRSQSSPLADEGTVDLSRDSDASTILPWLENLSLVPGHLLSRSEDTGFLQAIKDLKCEHDGPGRPFRQNHCGSFLQHLTSDLPDGSSDIWFISAASSIQRVENHSPTSANNISPTFLSMSELSSCPFPIYTHRQSAGDLLILPPSCYGQNLREGETCSISWSRITLHSLEISIYRELPMYRRCCRPERYEIRRTIHAALISCTAMVNQLVSRPVDVTSCGESLLSGTAQDLDTLVRLFDEILQEEYCNDHGSLDSAEIQQSCLTCNFCGSCLFLSSFLCRGCSQETSTSVLICAGCYTEGRSCRCGTMSPVRLGDFPGALRDRNNAVSSLSRASHPHYAPAEDLVEISESFFMWPRVAVFEAAKELWKLKNAPDVEKKGKTCTPRGGKPSHLTPPISLVNCKKCHAAKCFLHILEGFAHASEALLANAADSSSTIWHRRHQEARERNGLPLASLSRVRELDALDRRVFFARHFSSTLPLKPGMRIGFYDSPLQDTPLPSTGPSYNHPAPASQPSAPIPLSRTSSRSTVTLATDTEDRVAVDRRVRRTREQSIEEGTLAGPSGHRPKRARIPRSDDDNSDDEYLPRKRARLGRSTTGSIWAAQSTESAVPGTSDLPRQPTVVATTERPSGSDTTLPSSQLISDRRQEQPNVRQPILRRHPTRTASLESSLSRTSPATTHPPVADPLAWKFFNPSVDMEATVQSVEPTAGLPAFADIALTDRSETERHRRSSQNPFPQSSFVGLQSSFPRSSLSGAGQSFLYQPPRTEWSGSNSNTPSIVERLMPQGSMVAGSTRFYQQTAHTRLQRQGSAVQPPTSHTSSQVSGIATTSTTATLGRRHSQEDAAAQRVLETMRGDSLSRENMEAYVNILRNFGGLGKVHSRGSPLSQLYRPRAGVIKRPISDRTRQQLRDDYRRGHLPPPLPSYTVPGDLDIDPPYLIFLTRDPGLVGTGSTSPVSLSNIDVSDDIDVSDEIPEPCSSTPAILFIVQETLHPD